MKTRRLIAIFALSSMLIASPAFAQRGGGSRSGGSSSSSSSRSGGSYSGSSRSGGSYSSSSRSSSSYSSPSRSSGSYSSSSRSSSSYRSNSSYSSPSSRSESNSRSSSRNVSSSRSVGNHSTTSNRSGASPRGEASSRFNAPSRSGVTGSVENSRSTVGTPSSRTPGSVRERNGVRQSSPNGTPSASETQGRPSGTPNHDYARPGGKGGYMPPSHRPMHPAPYFHHPYHHHMIHMHPIIWHPIPPRPLFWPGFWLYCNSYWYDYHVTDVVVVNKYVKDTYNVDMVSYAISGDIMYAIVNDSDGNTYLQVFDKNDKLLAEQEISHKYIKTEIDRENGGCWIFKKRDKDPMLFLFVDGELLIYEAD